MVSGGVRTTAYIFLLRETVRHFKVENAEKSRGVLRLVSGTQVSRAASPEA